MQLTRVENAKVVAAVATARAKLDEALAALTSCLVLLTDEQRALVPRVRHDFPAAARLLAASSADHPELAAAVAYDAAAVIEDLDNVRALQPIADRATRIQKMIEDSRLEWLAEAFVPSLEYYGVAKVRAPKDAKLARDIAPLAEVFATTRHKPTPPPAK